MKRSARHLVAASLRASAKALTAALREDEYPDNEFSTHIKQVLGRYVQQHDYAGPEWVGVERLCYELAKAVPAVAIESVGWYSYPSGQDGKDWRYIIADPTEDGRAVVVNCHSLLHDGRWTLSTTIYSTADIDLEKTNAIGHGDHWNRTFDWEIKTAKLLQNKKYNYASAIADMELRLQASRGLRKRADKILPSVTKAFESLYGKKPELNRLSVGISEAPILLNKIGRHEGPKDEVDYSIITIHPDAAKSASYLEYVLKHELIHYVLAEDCGKYSHGSKFQDMAAELRLPREYRD